MKPIVVAVIAVVVGAGGFYGGMTYQKSKQATFRQGNFGPGNMMVRQYDNTGTGQGTQQRRGIMGNGGMFIGEITSIDDKTITLKTVDGGSKIVIVGSGTAYRKTVDGTSADVKQGDTVSVSGISNSDGSVTATTIQLNPGFKIAVPSTAPPAL